MADNTAGPTRAALAYGLLAGVVLLGAGLLVGFAERSTADLGGAKCGSVLGSGGDQLTAAGLAACDRALSAPTMWTVILLVGFALCVVVALIVNALQASRGAGSPTPAAQRPEDSAAG